MNPDADPKLEALFAEPMGDADDDARALRALLARLERTDRRRGLVLTIAGAVGAALALGILALTGAVPASIAIFSDLVMRALQTIAPWKTTSFGLPDGSIALGLGMISLAGAAALVLLPRWRS